MGKESGSHTDKIHTWCYLTTRQSTTRLCLNREHEGCGCSPATLMLASLLGRGLLVYELSSSRAHTQSNNHLWKAAMMSTLALAVFASCAQFACAFVSSGGHLGVLRSATPAYAAGRVCNPRAPLSLKMSAATDSARATGLALLMDDGTRKSHSVAENTAFVTGFFRGISNKGVYCSSLLSAWGHHGLEACLFVKGLKYTNRDLEIWACSLYRDLGLRVRSPDAVDRGCTEIWSLTGLITKI